MVENLKKLSLSTNSEMFLVSAQTFHVIVIALGGTWALLYLTSAPYRNSKFNSSYKESVKLETQERSRNKGIHKTKYKSSCIDTVLVFGLCTDKNQGNRPQGR